MTRDQLQAFIDAALRDQISLLFRTLTMRTIDKDTLKQFEAGLHNSIDAHRKISKMLDGM